MFWSDLDGGVDSLMSFFFSSSCGGVSGTDPSAWVTFHPNQIIIFEVYYPQKCLMQQWLQIVKLCQAAASRSIMHLIYCINK